MMTSLSDGIEASELRRPLTPPPSSETEPPKRGRPKKPARFTIDESETNTGNFSLGFDFDGGLDNGWNESRHDFFPQQHYLDPTPQREATPPSSTSTSVPNVVIDDLLAQQIDSFVYHLQLILQSSMDVPQEWIDQGIDPYVAMMWAKSQDPAYAK